MDWRVGVFLRESATRHARRIVTVAAAVMGTVAATGVGATYPTGGFAERGGHRYVTVLAESYETEGPKDPPVQGIAAPGVADADRRIIVY
jgi:hypothetical protein